ncbi:MAG: FAD/NAD(P)-binding protein [Mycobacteriaceae bacterium]|uniref:FAD/NAD(P)-binding protein n=1 Tax=Corynebacterium sp. TaxID=1720 RepID=UPI003F9CD6ED
MSPTIAILGGGPRGISVLERIRAACTASPPTSPLTVHLVDPAPGAGEVWRTDQSPTLCMNTLADAATMFTEPGSSVAAPVVEGPTFHEWMGEGRPDSHPPRAAFGRYLQWVLARVLDDLPEQITVEIHRTLATDISEGAGRDRISCADGTVIDADTTVLALGWTAPQPDAMESFMAASCGMFGELTWVRPGNPCDQDVDAIPSYAESGQDVLVRGLGMGFFDLMAMVTVDRGGRFVPDTASRSGLRYEASGREPHLVVASHHGYPYQPKPVYGSLPPAAVMPRFRAALDELPTGPGPGSVDFGAALWPAILRDAQAAYYTVLLRDDPERLAAVTELIDSPGMEPWLLHNDPALAELVPDGDDRFDLPSHADPVRGFTGTVGELTTFIADRTASDLQEAWLGRGSAVKAGLQVIGSARKPAALADEPGRFTLASRRSTYAELRRVGQMVGSGPPAFRTAELLCLIDAGYVRFLGSHPTVVIDPETPAFVMTSDTTGDVDVPSRTLVDAWMHKPDARSPSDPVTSALKDAGRLRPWAFDEGSGGGTGGVRTSRAPEVDPATGRLVRGDGHPDPRVHMIGIPMQDVRADRTISPMPGSDPVFLQETDAAAVSALRICGVELP